jgi:hypothetical protein
MSTNPSNKLGVHFINNVIKYFNDHFLLKHLSFTTYYPQGNGHAKSINKFIVNFIIKLVRTRQIGMIIYPLLCNN